MKFSIRDYNIDKRRLSNKLILKGVLYLIIICIIAFLILFIIPIQTKISCEAFLYRSGIPRIINSPSQGILYLNVFNTQRVNKEQIIATIDWELIDDEIDLLDDISNYVLQANNEESINSLNEIIGWTAGIVKAYPFSSSC